ncbi:uncharacterized protein PAC_17913 [Phialocephala subalpina]|uniref:Clr5 domain-containing protein n=1 Tax=Phialocephala subalpina TaxID=576137 RepID=A0A1L7XSJ6_9HELO|nr:uncharacterized protein PAC_17913 [Phialocephala subalpina]
MNSATRRIPPSEWKHWKPTILSLNQYYTLKEVMDIMMNTHGFRASKWQYEEQLRTWGASKYITQDAWAIIFETVDQLRSQDQEAEYLFTASWMNPKLKKRGKHTTRTKPSI